MDPLNQTDYQKKGGFDIQFKKILSSYKQTGFADIIQEQLKDEIFEIYLGDFRKEIIANFFSGFAETFESTKVDRRSILVAGIKKNVAMCRPHTKKSATRKNCSDLVQLVLPKLSTDYTEYTTFKFLRLWKEVQSFSDSAIDVWSTHFLHADKNAYYNSSSYISWFNQFFSGSQYLLPFHTQDEVLIAAVAQYKLYGLEQLVFAAGRDDSDSLSQLLPQLENLHSKKIEAMGKIFSEQKIGGDYYKKKGALVRKACKDILNLGTLVSDDNIVATKTYLIKTIQHLFVKHPDKKEEFEIGAQILEWYAGAARLPELQYIHFLETIQSLAFRKPALIPEYRESIAPFLSCSSGQQRTGVSVASLLYTLYSRSGFEISDDGKIKSGNGVITRLLNEIRTMPSNQFDCYAESAESMFENRKEYDFARAASIFEKHLQSSSGVLIAEMLKKMIESPQLKDYYDSTKKNFDKAKNISKDGITAYEAIFKSLIGQRGARDVGNESKKIKTGFLEELGNLVVAFPARSEQILVEFKKLQHDCLSGKHDPPMTLESGLLDGIKRCISLPEDSLPRMTSLFFAMYSAEDSHVFHKTHYFDKLAKAIVDVPLEHLSIVLDATADFLGKYPRPSEKKESLIEGWFIERAETTIKYVDAVKNIDPSRMGHFKKIHAKLFMEAKNKDSIEQFIHNIERNIKSVLHQKKGACVLDTCQELLLTYAQSLAGVYLEIEKSKSGKLFCSRKGTVLVLPDNLSLADTFDENLSLYKALISYQAGAFDFKSHDTPELRDPEKYFKKFGIPALAQAAYAAAEFCRLDGLLNKNYPGLRVDLASFKKYAVEELKYDKGGLLKTLAEISLGHSSTFEPNVVRDCTAHLSALREQCGSPTDAVRAAEQVYSICEKYWKKDDEKEREMLPVKLPCDGLTRPAAIARMQSAAAEKHQKKPGDVYYPEWDHTKKMYIPDAVCVVEKPANNLRSQESSLPDQGVVEYIKDMFERLHPENRVRVRKQLSGDVDIDALLIAKGDIIGGVTPSDKLFIRDIKNSRSVAAMLFSEVSGSLGHRIDLWKSPERYIDILRKTNLCWVTALEAMGDPYAISLVSGSGAKDVHFYVVKDFDQQYDAHTHEIVRSFSPQQQNRDGAGIRHALSLLNKREEKVRLFCYVMEGVPEDIGYKGMYAMEDTVKALSEVSLTGAIPVAFAVGREKNELCKRLKEENVLCYEIAAASKLPLILPEVYSRLTCV